MQHCYCLLQLIEVETNLFPFILLYLFYWFRIYLFNFLLTKASERNLRDEINALEEKIAVLEKSLTVHVDVFC